MRRVGSIYIKSSNKENIGPQSTVNTKRKESIDKIETETKNNSMSFTNQIKSTSDYLSSESSSSLHSNKNKKNSIPFILS
jgi:hypothetical protein